MPTKFLRPRALAAATAMLVAGLGWTGAAQAQQTFDENVTIETPNTPTLTFEQNDSNGWPPYSWDVRANEEVFAIRDLTTSDVIMRINSAAPTNSIVVAQEGGLDLGGRVAEGVTSAAVEDETEVDPTQILNGVRSLSLSQWQHAGDPDDVRHVGPLAGDFNAAFGLGEFNRVAPGDVAGVALAASQRLADENRMLNRRLQRTNRKVGRVAKQLRALKRAGD